MSTAVFGDHGHLVDDIHIDFSEGGGLSCSAQEAVERIATLLGREGHECERTDRELNLHGVSFTTSDEYTPVALRIRVDPAVADVALPIVEKAIREIRDEGIRGTNIRIDFAPVVACLRDHHKITGRVYGTDAKLAPKGYLLRGDIRFFISRLLIHRPGRLREGATYITMELLGDAIPTEQIRDLLAFLFERGLLFLEPEFVPYVE